MYWIQESILFYPCLEKACICFYKFLWKRCTKPTNVQITLFNKQPIVQTGTFLRDILKQPHSLSTMDSTECIATDIGSGPIRGTNQPSRSWCYTYSVIVQYIGGKTVANLIVPHLPSLYFSQGGEQQMPLRYSSEVFLSVLLAMCNWQTFQFQWFSISSPLKGNVGYSCTYLSSLKRPFRMPLTVLIWTNWYIQFKVMSCMPSTKFNPPCIYWNAFP